MTKSYDYLIYGAYGFTGKLITAIAKHKNHNVLLAGRDPKKLEELASEHQLPFVAFDLSNTTELSECLATVKAVLHCAGPFSQTAKPMMEACLKSGVHYLDITGEIDVFELGASYDTQAKAAGIVVMPGVGFDVVPTDCLALHLKNKLPDATSLELGFKGASKLSRGTALTMAENMHKGGKIRESGKLKDVPAAYKTCERPLNGKTQTYVSIPWGDVSTSYYTTGIPNIVVYTAVHPRQVDTMKTLYTIRGIFKWKWLQNYIQKKIKSSVHGPDSNLQETGKSYLWGEVKNDNGQKYAATLETIEGYKLTSITAVMAMEIVLQGSVNSGFNTPAMAFGEGFILKVEGSSFA
jgi:short subunit dehydrogenase-like uncharacterized protein